MAAVGRHWCRCGTRADPTGIDLRLLLRAGERPADLRRLVAYLILNGWAD